MALFRPTENDMLSNIHKVWNENGNGGDNRGRLLGMFNFDDGHCFQVNDSPISRYRRERYGHAFELPEGNDLWCGNQVTIPTEVYYGLFSLYWVWDWPTNPGGMDEKQEIYTTCMDVDIRRK
jgi:hypothetical protein